MYRVYILDVRLFFAWYKYSSYTRYILDIYSMTPCFFPSKNTMLHSINRVYIEYKVSICEVYILTKKQTGHRVYILDKYSKYTSRCVYILNIYLIYPHLPRIYYLVYRVGTEYISSMHRVHILDARFVFGLV